MGAADSGAADATAKAGADAGVGSGAGPGANGLRLYGSRRRESAGGRKVEGELRIVARSGLFRGAEDGGEIHFAGGIRIEHGLAQLEGLLRLGLGSGHGLGDGRRHRSSFHIRLGRRLGVSAPTRRTERHQMRRRRALIGQNGIGHRLSVRHHQVALVALGKGNGEHHRRRTVGRPLRGLERRSNLRLEDAVVGLVLLDQIILDKRFGLGVGTGCIRRLGDIGAVGTLDVLVPSRLDNLGRIVLLLRPLFDSRKLLVFELVVLDRRARTLQRAELVHRMVGGHGHERAIDADARLHGARPRLGRAGA